MLDPSTNTNPLDHPDEMSDQRAHAGDDPLKKKKKKRSGDVSKHTFYIENSQMRLKLFARNEVRFGTYMPGSWKDVDILLSVKCYNGSPLLRKSLQAPTIQVVIDSTALHLFG